MCSMQMFGARSLSGELFSNSPRSLAKIKADRRTGDGFGIKHNRPLKNMMGARAWGSKGSICGVREIVVFILPKDPGVGLG